MLALVAGSAGAAPTGPAPAAPASLRVGTGPATGASHAIGRALADGLSHRTGPDCPDGCGLPNARAAARPAATAAATLRALREGELEAGLVPADAVAQAHDGAGAFEGGPAFGDLRVLATLFTASLHVLVRPDAGIERIRDLAGRRAWLGRHGSAEAARAGIVMRAHGLETLQGELGSATAAEAAAALDQGRLDAIVLTAGHPAGLVAELARRRPVRLVPVDGAALHRIRRRSPELRATEIPGDAYAGVSATPTIGVAVQLVADAAMPAPRAYRIVDLLWSAAMAERLATAHPRGADIRLGAALPATGVPLHPGAASWYYRRGLLP